MERFTRNYLWLEKTIAEHKVMGEYRHVGEYFDPSSQTSHIIFERSKNEALAEVRVNHPNYDPHINVYNADIDPHLVTSQYTDKMSLFYKHIIEDRIGRAISELDSTTLANTIEAAADKFITNGELPDSIIRTAVKYSGGFNRYASVSPRDTHRYVDGSLDEEFFDLWLDKSVGQVKSAATLSGKTHKAWIGEFLFGSSFEDKLATQIDYFFVRKFFTGLCLGSGGGSGGGRSLSASPGCDLFPSGNTILHLSNGVPQSDLDAADETLKALKSTKNKIAEGSRLTAAEHASHKSNMKELGSVTKSIARITGVSVIIYYYNKILDKWFPVNPFSSNFSWGNYYKRTAGDLLLSGVLSGGNGPEIVADMVVNLTVNNLTMGQDLRELVVPNIVWDPTMTAINKQPTEYPFSGEFVYTPSQLNVPGVNPVYHPILDYKTEFFDTLKELLRKYGDPAEQPDDLFRPLNLLSFVEKVVKKMSDDLDLGWGVPLLSASNVLTFSEIATLVVSWYMKPTDSMMLSQYIQNINKTAVYNLESFHDGTAILLMKTYDEDEGVNKKVVLTYDRLDTEQMNGAEFVDVAINSDDNYFCGSSNSMYNIYVPIYTPSDPQIPGSQAKYNLTTNIEQLPCGLYGNIRPREIQDYTVNIDAYDGGGVHWTLSGIPPNSSIPIIIARSLPKDAVIIPIQTFLAGPAGPDEFEGLNQTDIFKLYAEDGPEDAYIKASGILFSLDGPPGQDLFIPVSNEIHTGEGYVRQSTGNGNSNWLFFDDLDTDELVNTDGIANPY